MPVSRETNPRLFVVGEIHGRPESPQPSGPGRGVPGARIWCRETLTQPGAAQCRASIASDVRSPPASIIHGPPRGNHGHSAPSALICSASNLNGIEQLTAHSGGSARVLLPGSATFGDQIRLHTDLIVASGAVIL